MKSAPAWQSSVAKSGYLWGKMGEGGEHIERGAVVSTAHWAEAPW